MKKCKLLIVDADANSLVLARTFKLMGHDVKRVASGEKAIPYIIDELYDLMLIDLNLPKMSGFDVITLLHKKQPHTSVIVHSSPQSIDDVISAFKSNIADFLRKPVTIDIIIDAVLDELHKREVDQLKSHLISYIDSYPNELLETASLQSNGPPVEQEEYALFIEPILLNRSDKTVRLSDGYNQEIQLTRGETAVLWALMSHPNTPLSCQQIVQSIWHYESDKEAAQSIIRPYVSRLRKKLNSFPSQTSLIHTVRNRGYAFTTSVETI